MNLERLYLDYNATSPLSQSVSNWLESGDFLFANPSSQHSNGKSSRKLINQSRSYIYETFGKSESDTNLFFHSGATEAFHTFAYSFSELARLNGKDLLICYSRVDHPAVTSLELKYFGSHVKFHEVQRDQKLNYLQDINFEFIKDKKDNNPDLIILYHHLWVHNETGQVEDLNKLLKLKSIPDLYIHVDAVQAPGKINNWQNLELGDIWSFSAHKFGALKGIGFSFFNKSLPFNPLIQGGGQQFGLRSGTENPMAVRSISLALSDLLKINVNETARKREDLVDFFRKELKTGRIVEHGKMSSNTIYFYLDNLSSDIALAMFDLNGIEISAGSACSSGAAKTSQILNHMGLQSVSKNGLRLSLPFEVSDALLLSIKLKLSEIFKKIN